MAHPPPRALPEPDLLALDTPDTLELISQALPPAADGRSRRQVVLTIDGVHCAACVLSIEAALAPQVESMSVNAATRRASLVFSPEHQPLSGLFATVRALGYTPRPVSRSALNLTAQAGRRAALWRMLVAVLCMMQVMMYATPRYVAGEGDMTTDIHHLLLWAEWMLTLPVLIFSAWPFLRGAWRDLRARRIGMDVPVTLGLGVMFVSSSLSLTGSGALSEPVWFDSITMFAAFLLVGRWLESAARERALAGLADLLAELPRTVLRENAHGVPEPVTLPSLQTGDWVHLCAGEAIPADGTVPERSTQVDESALTGESHAVLKPAGSLLLAGTLLLSGPVRLQVKRPPRESRAQEVADLIAAASAARPRWAREADRWAGPFLVAVLILAAGAAVLWSLLDPDRAISVAVAVLIVTCPCALSIAAPAAMLAGSAALAREGVLLRSPDALEALARIDHLMLDKTGTLTEAQPTLQAIERLADGPPGMPVLDETGALALAGAAERLSMHPIGRALRQAALERPDASAWMSETESIARLQDVQEHPGQGLSGHWSTSHGRWSWRLGSLAFATGPSASEAREPHKAVEALDTAKRLERSEPCEATEVWLSVADHLVARFVLAQSLRPQTVEAMTLLRAQGIMLGIRSGDQHSAVRSVAERLKITDWAARQSAQDKLQDLTHLQGKGHRVGMVGDGLNDGAALAQADVSISFAQATPLAQQQADVLLLGSSLLAIARARAHGQRCMGVVRQNLAFAAAYNLCCIPLALIGWMPPWLAGLGMAGSSLVVVLNALRVAGPRRTRAADEGTGLAQPSSSAT